MKVRLTRKHAECIDGIDLRSCVPGDLLELPQTEAALLVAEQWAILERRERCEAPAIKRRADDDPEKS